MPKFGPLSVYCSESSIADKGYTISLEFLPPLFYVLYVACVCVCVMLPAILEAHPDMTADRAAELLPTKERFLMFLAAVCWILLHFLVCLSILLSAGPGTHRQCARSLSVRFAQYRQGKTYVWQQPHACMPQEATLWGALGYFEGSDKVHLNLTVILPLRHPHAACALQRLTFQSMPDSLVFWSIHPSS